MQSGEATVLTDAFALGVTVLMALTSLPTANIRQRCRHMQKWPTQPSRWQAPGVPDKEAGSWDEAVAISLAEIVVGVTELWEEDRMPLSEVLERLEAMAVAAGADAPAVATEARLCIICEEAPREVRFACGHATVCKGCLPVVVERHRKCPWPCATSPSARSRWRSMARTCARRRRLYCRSDRSRGARVCGTLMHL
eukprot:scaffold64412_cov59-Phaeocystis_antarctica.AAC.2